MERDIKNSFSVESIIFLIRFYQKVLSPLLPSSCRYHPSCSQYAILALKRFGLLKGLRKAVIRILKCNPLFPGGYDPI